MEKLVIQTQRLTLRPITLNDLDEIHRLHILPETDEFNALGIPKDLDETQSVITPWVTANNQIEVSNYTFAILHQKTGGFMGLFGLRLGAQKYKRAEIWYKFHKDEWGNGYATEAVKAVLNYGFNTLKFHRIEAGCAVDNIGSAKVLEKSGMIKEGVKRQILPLKTGWSDSFEYAILESDKRY
ncbi:GNAT family N-acetyltransferase [Maribacter litoralis]|uniref:GNAT family N-acetyltransferase n=1 Tax=Maribacter litoralis TaxID=2059726 RepID=UPI003D29C2C4